MSGARGFGDLDRLLALALADPTEALDAARALLAATPTPVEAAVAHQAVGIVLRDFGDVSDAVAELRTARRWARRARDPVREADVLSTLGSALVMAGSTRRGMTAMADAMDLAGAPSARLLIRRSHVQWLVGRHEGALRDAERAVVLLHDGTDVVWQARAFSHRAMANLALGSVASADADYARCEALFARSGQHLEYAAARQDRASAAFVRGDLPTALTLLDDAERIVDGLGVFEPELLVTRCLVLVEAGLFRDALATADDAVARMQRQGGAATRLAELTHVAGLAAQACGRLDDAVKRSTEAVTMFRRQQRPWWAARALLVRLQSGLGGGEPAAEILPRAVRLAGELRRLGSAHAADAHLLAGRAALVLGRRQVAARELQAATTAGRRDPHARAVGWLARATLHESREQWAPMLAACGRGLDLVEAHLGTLGATELRAEATAQGSELAAIALRHAVRNRDPRRLLLWSERRRASAVTVPAVRPDAEGEMAADLAAVRALAYRTHDGAPAAPLLAERRRLETAVRRRALRQPPRSGPRAERVALGELRGELGDTDLVELTDVDGELYAVLVTRARPPRWFHVGPAARADRAIAQALFALRRTAVRPGGHALDPGRIGERLQTSLLAGVADALRGGPVVIVPTGRLHAVPWAMMPRLADLALTVAPSAAAWLRSRRAVAPVNGRVVLVGGPGLTTGAQEVRGLAAQRPDAEVLVEGDATCERVLAAIDGAALVHVAAHGTFRADSPLLSALDLDDGPLTAYDLERLTQAPHRIVLSSCNSAVGAPSGADELLGIVSVLISSGAATVIASVVPVDDPATVPLMLALHGRLPDVSAGVALRDARRAVRDDPRGRAAGDSFLAFGA